MELNEYQKQAMSTCTKSSNNDAYMILNLIGEVGEVCSKLAKLIRKEEANMNENQFFIKVKDREPIALELGDVLWQLSGTCNSLGFSLEEVAQMNLSKLRSRKERNKIIGEGDKR